MKTRTIAVIAGALATFSLAVGSAAASLPASDGAHAHETTGGPAATREYRVANPRRVRVRCPSCASGVRG